MTGAPRSAAEPGTYLAAHEQAIAEARARIAGHVRRTPTLPTDLDPRLRLKPECFQVTGSFKARGAFNAVLALKESGRPTEGVIAVSSGTHAQALALAARTAGLKAVILIPEDANPQKVAATRAYGAEVIQDGVTFANREERLKEVMAERGLTLVHPFDDWDIIHGAASAAVELLEDEPELSLVAAPTGGGGLLSGTALASKARHPGIQVVGVEPERADDARQTFLTGRLHTLPEAPTTIADGVRTVHIGERNFEVMVERRLVDDIVTVSEDEIADAVVTAWTRLKLALEPTGCLPLAAFLAGKLPPTQGPVGLLLSGGNADLRLVARLLTR